MTVTVKRAMLITPVHPERADEGGRHRRRGGEGGGRTARLDR